MGRASELLILGDKLSAQRAYEIGLAMEVVADDELQARAQALARQIAEGPSFAYSTTKVLLTRELDMDLGSALELEAVTQALLMKSEPPRVLQSMDRGTRTELEGTMSSHNRIFNSPDLALPSGFAHAVVAGTTVYLGGQTAQRPDGSIEASTLAAQFDLAASNLITALRAAGGEPDESS